MANSIFTLNTIAEVIAVFEDIKANGRFATLYCETPIKLNKTARDNRSERRAEDFNPTKAFSVTYNFNASYDKKMSELLGIDYKADGTNRRHLVKNVIMEYISTGNACCIYMPNNYGNVQTLLNGREMTAEELAYMARFKAPKKSNALVEYRTVKLVNVKQMVVNNTTYVFNIGRAERMAG